jgi:hypothetical protein
LKIIGNKLNCVISINQIEVNILIVGRSRNINVDVFEASSIKINFRDVNILDIGEDVRSDDLGQRSNSSLADRTSKPRPWTLCRASGHQSHKNIFARFKHFILNYKLFIPYSV